MAFIQPRQNNIGNTLFLNDNKIGIGTDNPNQLLTIEGSVSIKEQASANTDTAEYGQVWVKNSDPNELYFTNDSGHDIQLTSGSGIYTNSNSDITNSILYSNHDIYINSNNSWTQLGSDIDGEAAFDLSGRNGNLSLSADGTIVAIGAYFNDGGGSNAGHVRIFKYDSTSWTQLGSDIDGEAANDSSASVSLSADGTIVAIGANSNDGGGSDAGRVRVFKYDGTSWNQLGNNINGEADNDGSGNSVSLSADGTIVAIGAISNDGGGSNSGHARVFKYDGTSWNQLGSDIDGEAADDQSGFSVSLSADGTIVAIGSPNNDGTGSNAGHVRVYKYNGNDWTQLGNDIDGEAAGDLSGWSISLSADGTIVAIGAYLNNGTGSNAGHVRIYKYNGSSWTQLGSDIDGEAADDFSGYSVSLNSSGNIVAIGAILNDGTGSDAGHVRVYKYSGSVWTKLGSDIDAEAAGDSNGNSVSLNSSGNIIAIGASNNNGGGSNAGHVRIFNFAEEFNNVLINNDLNVQGDVGIGTTSPNNSHPLLTIGNSGGIGGDNASIILDGVQEFYISSEYATQKLLIGTGTGNSIGSNIIMSFATSGTVSMNNNLITNVSNPTSDQDAATKSYVDSVATGLDLKESCRVATTTSGTLSTAFENGDSIDNVVLVTGDRILIKNQSTGTENGIYIVNASGAPTRSTDLSSGTDASGVFTFIEEGDVNGDNGFVCTSNTGSAVVGTNNLTFTKFSSTGLTFGISENNVIKCGSGIVDDDFLRINGTTLEGRSASEVLSDIGGQSALTFGKSSGNALKSQEALTTNDVLLMGTNHVKGRTYAELKTDLSLNNVENTAISTFAGSSNIVTVGTITTGTWTGTAIADAYISSASTWNNKQDALTFGKSSGNALKSQEALTTNDVLLMGTNHVKGRTYAELKTDLSLNNVENTAISTFAGSSNITTLGTISGNLTVDGDLILDDGGSIKEAGGTAAITISGTGEVTKLGQDSPSSGEFLKWDGSKVVWDAVSGGGGAVSAVSNGANNRIATFSSSDALNGEANLTFDGTKLGIGTSSPSNILQINHTGGDGNDGLMIVREDSSTESTNLLGGIGFDSTDGNVPSSIEEASAYIAGYASENHSTDDKGGYLTFGTASENDNDDTTSKERMRITDEGYVKFYGYNSGGSLDSILQISHAIDNGVPLIGFSFGRNETHIANQTVRPNITMWSHSIDPSLLFYANRFQFITSSPFDTTQTNTNKFNISTEGRVGINKFEGSLKNTFEIHHAGSDGDNGMLIVRDDTSTAANDLLGGIGFDSNDGDGSFPSSILEASAYIAGYASENHSDSDKGGHLTFGTAPDNQSKDEESSERMRITSSGNVGIGTTSPYCQVQIGVPTRGDGETSELGKLVVAGPTSTPTNDFSSSTAIFRVIGTNATNNLQMGVGGDGDYNYNPWIQAGGDNSVGSNNFFTKDLLLNPLGGNVGIGVTDAAAKLQIKQISNQSSDDGSGLRFVQNGNTNRWDLLMWTDDNFVFHYNGNPKGFIYDSGSNSQFNFTGQHRCLSNNSITTSSIGLIVSASGNYIDLNNQLGPTINDSLPIVQITNTDNDKRVFGVLSDKEDTENSRRYGPGNFVSVYDKTNTNEQRLFINSVGEGGIWICNKGSGNIENGDYITSSSVTGYGMKQTLHEGILTNFTVAKITCDCDFSLEKITKQKLKVITTTTDGVTTTTTSPEGITTTTTTDPITTTSIDYDESGNVQYEDDLDEDGNIQQVYKYETRFLDENGNLLVDEADYNTRLANEESVYIACFVGCTYHCG